MAGVSEAAEKNKYFAKSLMKKAAPFLLSRPQRRKKSKCKD
jgi:hypothetical protein